MISQSLLEHLIKLIQNRIGLQIRDSDHQSFSKEIQSRIKALKLRSPEEYYQLLNDENSDHLAKQETLGQREWKTLTILLTTGETYFFRDSGQLTIISSQILPELIKYKSNTENHQGNTTPSLRIWSAGCSTGEEVYSLAIMLSKAIPDYRAWDLLILGTDINVEAIEKAQRGLYREWSFRAVKPDVKQQYFKYKHGQWEINEQIREMVKFRPGNLLGDPFPSLTSDLHSMDMIICRNVFIYFNSATIATILEKFCQTLNPGGYLITGHTELHDQNLGKLKSKIFSDSVVYQRRRGFLATPLPETTPLETDSFPHPFTIPSLSQSGNGKIETGDLVSPNAHSPLSINSQPILPTIPLGSYFPTQFRDLVQENSIGQTLPLKIISSPTINSQPETSTANHVTLDDAKKMFEQGNYAQAIQQLEQLIEQQPNNSEVYYLISQAHANVGDYAQATYFCEKVLQLDSLLIKPYYLLAQIAELQGNIIQAKELLKKIIYLDSNYISAYLDLGSLCEQEGDFNRSKKMYSTAIELLEALSSDLTIDYRGEVTVGELHTQVKATLCRLP